MNNIKFVNHVILFSLYPMLLKSQQHKQYMSLYRFFPTPPGVEYMLSRSQHMDIKSPWIQETTEYPLPAMPDTAVSFADAADDFGYNTVQQIDQGKILYIMWSGGIDSTSMVVSVLKHLQPAQRERVWVVSSALSRNENPMFYHNFLKTFQQIELSQFDPAKIDLATSLILDGEGGDQIFGSSAANRIFSKYPDMLKAPWKNNTDFLRKFWHSELVPDFYDFFMYLMNTTIDNTDVPVETLFDFFWWLNFNFKFDSVMFRHTLRLSENISDHDFKFFSQKVCHRMFATEKMQQWSMTAGADGKINQARKTVKWGGRKYIYDFDRNEYYFREKRKEFSFQTIADGVAKYFAVDRDYNRYSLANHSTRLDIRQKFYPYYDPRVPMHSVGQYLPSDDSLVTRIDIS